MNILVYNPAALNGGAINILNNFIQDITKDSKNKYWIVVGEEVEDIIRVKNAHISFVNIERSYLKRLRWLYFDMPKFIAKYNIDAVLSFENTCNVFLKNVPQYVYLHQSLQFAPLNTLSWDLYLKIKILNGLLMKYSCKRAAGVIVQTEWMSQAVVNNFNISSSNVHIIPPELPNYNTEDVDRSIISKVKMLSEEGKYIGICVTSAYSYKCLETLVEFVAKYNRSNTSFRICMLFTISPDQNAYARDIYSLAKELHVLQDIIFTGQLTAATLHQLYDFCDALFYSSAVETLGFPLVEAMSHKMRIFAPDLPYVKDVCNKYAVLYQFRDSDHLVKQFIENFNEIPIEESKYKGENFLKAIEILNNHNNLMLNGKISKE